MPSRVVMRRRSISEREEEWWLPPLGLSWNRRPKSEQIRSRTKRFRPRHRRRCRQGQPNRPLAGTGSRSRSHVDPVRRRFPPPSPPLPHTLPVLEEPPTASAADRKEQKALPGSSSSQTFPHCRWWWHYWWRRRRRGQPRGKSTRRKRSSTEVAAAVLVLARGWSSLPRQKVRSERYAIARGAGDGPGPLLLLSTAAKNAAAASNRHSQKLESRRRFLLDHDPRGDPQPSRYPHSSDWKSTSANAKESIAQTGSGDVHWPGSSEASRSAD